MTKELQQIEHNGTVWSVGSKVLVSARMNSYLATISRITDGRGGTIYTKRSNDSNYEPAYDLRGIQRGGDCWSRANISPATQKDIDLIKGRAAICQLGKYKWSTLSPEIAIEIRNYLREKYSLEIK